ncbi:sestrin-2 isoform X2 [Aplysia californica]|uniref:Sestrin-2 isoform X2 n=1 Tax=Aplysia californica TaxID=6500 RepID=A0ABM0ZVL2_APLCA|nr:sestrin-2 isoform X2 [Aplysia californica]
MKDCLAVSNRVYHSQRAVALPHCHYDYLPLDVDALCSGNVNDHFYDDVYGSNDIEDMHVDSTPIQSSPHSMEVVPADTTVEDNQSVFMEAFLQNNRLEHISQVMGYHPDYLRNFLTTQNFLLREDGPLPYEYRHYIAIMAAARHHCTYLVKLHEQDFLLHNGDPQWLKGIAHAPRKLQDLYEVNKILAHQPWLITKQHIHNLLKSPEPWSLSELMQAIILLTHFHSLCSFVYGCGINPELDMQGFSLTQPASPATDSDSSEANSDTGDTINVCGDEESVGLEALLARMRQLDAISSANTTSPEELLKRFHSVEHQNAEITVPSGKNNSPRAEILRFVQDPEFSYIDFASRDSVSEVATFRACDYSWDDHGFSLANRLYLDVGTLLDDKYNLAANLTYYTMGDNREVDTSSFRRAIWNYIHCMYGIRHDDYDYSEVNQLLERNLKGYIKTLTCYPERLTKKDYDGVMREFKHSEKVHVNLMLMEARQQAELLYALRALNRYMT